MDPQEFNELLEHLKSPNFNHITSINSFYFSTVNTTSPNDKMKNRLAGILWNSFIFKKDKHSHEYSEVGHDETYFVKEH